MQHITGGTSRCAKENFIAGHQSTLHLSLEVRQFIFSRLCRQFVLQTIRETTPVTEQSAKRKGDVLVPVTL